MRSFQGVFIAVVLATALILGAFMVNQRRPRSSLVQANVQLIRATGKCAECHRAETAAVVHEFEMSRHNAAGVTCMNCHEPKEGQEAFDHKGFRMAKKVTSLSCKQCHPNEVEQYMRSRHAAPAWAAVTGPGDFTPEQIAFAEAHNPGAVDRPAHALVEVQGPAAITKGCQKCHDIGRPNADGSIGQCTACHARHVASVELARTPETCGQCHMGPDHSQLEIYHESKHGVIFNAQKQHFNLSARPKELTVNDMPVPTCATCHMSGIVGEEHAHDVKPTHNVGERLSYFLFAPVSERRPDYKNKQMAMKETCLNCHTNPKILEFYREAEGVVKSTNKLVKEAEQIIVGLRKDGLLTPEPFDEPIEYLNFDLWHYGGRTAKHGAFMGGADFVQWHGYYEIVAKLAELKHDAEEIRARNKAESVASPAPAQAIDAPPAPKGEAEPAAPAAKPETPTADGAARSTGELPPSVFAPAAPGE
jgi:hypothetical protein